MATITQRPASLGAGWAFNAIWSKSLREHRVAIISWGIALGLVAMATLAASPQITTVGSQSAISQITQSFRFFGDPVAMSTPQGYVTWKTLGMMPVLLGIWAVLAGASLTRADEERAALELVLAEPISRTRLLMEKVVAFALSLLLVGLMIAGGVVLGQALARLQVDVWAALLIGLNVSLASFIYGALALFFSQFTRRAGSAAGLAGVYMALDFVVAGVGRSVDGWSGIERVTINFYYELSKPLIASYGVNPGAMLVLLALSVALVGASLWLFAHRDEGDVISLWSRLASHKAATTDRLAAGAALARTARDVSLRGVAARTLGAQASTIGWWALGPGIYAFWGAFIAKSIEQQIAGIYKSTPFVAELFKGANLATNAGFLSAIIFSYIPVVVVFAAIFFALEWATELDLGRLEVTMDAPLPRWRQPLERFVVVVVGVAAVVVAIWLPASLGALLSGLSFDGGRVFVATLTIAPMALLAAALVYALAGRMSSGAILGVVGALTALSFLIDFLSDILKLPDWALKLSIFHAYGQPMLDGANWTASLVMLALALALLALGTFEFTRADVRN